MRNLLATFIFSLVCLSSLKAQDSLLPKNQLYGEFLGNNFYDPNTGFSTGLISLNYSRKLMLKKSCLVFSLGVGFVRSNYAFVNNNSPTILDFPVGILFKPGLKRSGLLFGVFFIPSIGKIGYSINDGRNYIHYYHNSSWQISPNLSYEFQPKSEKFFCRLTLSPKFLLPFFTKSIAYGKDWTIVPWGGISIGGGW